MIDVEQVPGELLILGGTNICAGAISVTGAAGEAARAQLFNPADSGKLLTVSKLIIAVGFGAVIRIAINNLALTTAVNTEIFRDRRNPITNRPTGVIRTDSTVALADANMQFFLGSGGLPVIIEDKNAIAVLSPGSGIQVGMNVNAQTIFVTFLWRERVAEPSELNL